MRRMAPRRRMREAKLRMGPVVRYERNPSLTRGGCSYWLLPFCRWPLERKDSLARQCQHIYEATDCVALVT